MMPETGKYAQRWVFVCKLPHDFWQNHGFRLKDVVRFFRILAGLCKKRGWNEDGMRTVGGRMAASLHGSTRNEGICEKPGRGDVGVRVTDDAAARASGSGEVRLQYSREYVFLTLFMAEDLEGEDIAMYFCAVEKGVVTRRGCYE